MSADIITKELEIVVQFLASSPAERVTMFLHGLAAVIDAYRRAHESGSETAKRHAREDLEWFVSNPQWRR